MATLFGSPLRSDVLVAISRLQPTYPAELARVLVRRPIEIQRSLESLERAGVVSTRMLGRTRVVELDRRFPGAGELYSLLLRLSEERKYSDRFRDIRKRPRAMRKSL